jgi:hypothetical protein
VLNRLRRDGLLIVIDTNPMFIDYLKATISDSRFVAVNGSAADVEAIVRAHGHQNADYVLSACPFDAARWCRSGHRFGHASRAAPGGAFLVYQFTSRARAFMARHFTRIDAGWNSSTCRPASSTGVEGRGSGLNLAILSRLSGRFPTSFHGAGRPAGRAPRR